MPEGAQEPARLPTANLGLTVKRYVPPEDPSGAEVAVNIDTWGLPPVEGSRRHAAPKVVTTEVLTLGEPGVDFNVGRWPRGGGMEHVRAQRERDELARLAVGAIARDGSVTRGNSSGRPRSGNDARSTSR